MQLEKATLVQQFKDSYRGDRKRQFDSLFLEKYNASMSAVLSPVNNQYNAARDKVHSFALQFGRETEAMIQLSLKTSSRQKRKRSWLCGQGIQTTFQTKFCLWTLAWYKRKWLCSHKTLMMHIEWLHLLSTQVALAKTQSTDLDYKHVSSISVA